MIFHFLYTKLYFIINSILTHYLHIIIVIHKNFFPTLSFSSKFKTLIVTLKEANSIV